MLRKGQSWITGTAKRSRIPHDWGVEYGEKNDNDNPHTCPLQQEGGGGTYCDKTHWVGVMLMANPGKASDKLQEKHVADIIGEI